VEIVVVIAFADPRCGQSPLGKLLLSQRVARIRPGRVSRRNETR
jgi:hypothetical protein